MPKMINLKWAKSIPNASWNVPPSYGSRTFFAMAGLRVTSTLRLHHLMTVTTALIMRELGELSPQMQDEVANKLQKLFGLA